MKEIYCDSSVWEACIFQDGSHNIAIYPARVTNNVGEYRAVLWAVRVSVSAQELVTVFTDSKLVVEQSNGRWKCRKSHLVSYCDEVKRLLRQYPHIRLEWVSREGNPAGKVLEKRKADELL